MIFRTVNRLFWKLIQHVFSMHCGDISSICVYFPQIIWVESFQFYVKKGEALLFYRVHNSYLWQQSSGMIFTSSYRGLLCCGHESILLRMSSWCICPAVNLRGTMDISAMIHMQSIYEDLLTQMSMAFDGFQWYTARRKCSSTIHLHPTWMSFIMNHITGSDFSK